MREFYELVNQYPWTTVLLVVAICCILNAFGDVIHNK